MNSRSFRKRGERRVTVFSGDRMANAADEQLRQRPEGGLKPDIIHKGMTISQVEQLLGLGESDPAQPGGIFSIVNYRGKGNGIVVVYRDRRVVSYTSLPLPA